MAWRAVLRSFRFRIALLSAVLSGVVLAGFGTAAWLWLRHERWSALDREIRALAYRHPGWMNQRANFERLAGAIEFIFGAERRDQLILLAQDTTGTIHYRSEHWPAAIPPESIDLTLDVDPDPASPRREPGGTHSTGRTGAGDAEPGEGIHAGWGRGPGGGRGLGPGGGGGGGGMVASAYTRIPRFVSVRTETTTWRLGILGNDHDRLVVGIDGAELLAELARLRDRFLLSLPLVLGLIGAGGWWVAGRAVRPLRRIARAAEHIHAQALDQRIPADDEDPEIQRLIAVLNGMMDRLERSFRQATRFSADASHELKTPLTVMQAELEQAIQAAEAGSREQRVYASLLEETQRLKSIARSLLLLAQADSGRLPLSREGVDLAGLLLDLAADARVLGEPQALVVETDLPPSALVNADRALLRLALSNLLENAVHYNLAGGRIRVGLETVGGEVRIRVVNTGPAIPPEDRSRVFERFHRGDLARGRRRDGAGLGLSLAREILAAHGGDLVLVDSGPAGTEFEARLPRDR